MLCGMQLLGPLLEDLLKAGSTFKTCPLTQTAGDRKRGVFDQLVEKSFVVSVGW